MINAILNLLRLDGYITVHKALIKAIGLIAATLFAELCSKYKYYLDEGKLKDGWFYLTISKLESELSLSRKEQDTALNKLIALGFLEKKVMKLKGDDSPKRYIKITQDVNLILSYIQGKVDKPIENTGFVPKGQIDMQQKDKLEKCEENDPNPLKTLDLTPDLSDFFDLSEKGKSTCDKGTTNNNIKQDLYNTRRKPHTTDPRHFNKLEISAPSSSQCVCFNNTHSKINKNIQEFQTEEVERLQKEIREVIGQQVNVKKIKELLISSSLERIQFHLANWHIHKQNQVKPGAGYFITVIANDIEPLAPEKKTCSSERKNGNVPLKDNFEQRKYTQEEWEEIEKRAYAHLEEPV